MNRHVKRMAVPAACGLLTLSGVLLAVSANAAEPAKEWSGMELAMDRQKGNCLSCHDMPGVSGVELPGNVGPPLVNIRPRYEREQLRLRIEDAAKVNPMTSMPPFGRNKILTDQEIDKVTDFILNL